MQDYLDISSALTFQPVSIQLYRRNVCMFPNLGSYFGRRDGVITGQNYKTRTFFFQFSVCRGFQWKPYCSHPFSICICIRVLVPWFSNKELVSFWNYFLWTIFSSLLPKKTKKNKVDAAKKSEISIPLRVGGVMRTADWVGTVTAHHKDIFRLIPFPTKS